MRPWRLASAAAPWTLPACAVVTVLLGFWGWLHYGQRVDNALYRAITLFALSNEMYRSPPGSTDWRFLIGRWTGLLAVFGAALFALMALLRKQAVVALAQLVPRRVAVIGASDLASKAYDWAQASGRSVVWLGAHTLDAHRLNAFALPWPADDPQPAVAKYVADADRVLVVEDDPATSLVLAKLARAVAPRAAITVMLNDSRLAEDAAEMISEPRTRVLSAATVSARALHIAHPPFLIARDLGHRRIHALIVGFGQAGQAIARDLVVNCRTTYLERPRITVIDPQARTLEGAIRLRAPELDQCLEMVFVEGELGTEGVEPGLDALMAAVAAGGPVTAVYVCRQGDAESLGAAGMAQSLLRLADLGDAPVFTRLRDAHSLTRAVRGGEGLNALIPFGDTTDIIAASEFLSDSPDRAARAFSEAYRATLTEVQRNDPANSSARPWDELRETYREATREAVAHIPAKLASAGVAPALWLGVSGPPRLPPEVRLFETEAELEALAALEHERWNAQRRFDGWRWADLAAKDERRRLHPALVPYADLPETLKTYDRAIVRETQAIGWAMRGMGGAR